MTTYPTRTDKDICDCTHESCWHTTFGFNYGKCHLCECKKYKFSEIEYQKKVKERQKLFEWEKGYNERQNLREDKQ